MKVWKDDEFGDSCRIIRQDDEADMEEGEVVICGIWMRNDDDTGF